MHQKYIVEQGPVQLHAEEEQQVLAVEAGWPESAVAGRLLLILAGTQQGSGEPAADDLLLDVPELDLAYYWFLSQHSNSIGNISALAAVVPIRIVQFYCLEIISRCSS